MRVGIAALTLLGLGSPVLAQEADLGSAEIIVTGSRREDDSFDERRPVVGLRRTADFAIQPIVITGDTRDTTARYSEVYQTALRAIQAAPAHGVQLAFGETIVEPVTVSNYKDITLEGDNRPDTNRMSLLVKIPLSASVDAREAAARVVRFRKAVQPVGRALIEERGDLTLSIVGPDQYRGQITAAIAADASATAASFGSRYGVEVKGLNRPVEWVRAGLTEVFLYVPYELTITPSGG